MKLKLLILTLVLPIGISAQTMQWAVRPTFAQIEDYGQLLKVRNNGKTGLADRNGTTVIPVEYDSIGAFRDGYALLMNRSGKRLKIEAVVTEGDYEIQPVLEDVYATRYAWFCDSKMPVVGNGGWGYLGTDGNIAIPCQFQQAYPFSEGFASVKISDKAYFINRDMDYLNVEAGYGDLVFASTFSGNEAVVYSVNMKGYVINRRGRIVRPFKTKVEDLKTNRVDHSVGDRAQKYEEQVKQLEADNSYTIYEENGMYGYRRNGHVVLPAQLDKAEPVRGSYAKVVFKGKNGVLHIVEGNVDTKVVGNTVEVRRGRVGYGTLQLSLPDDMEDAAIRVRIVDARDRELQVKATTSRGVVRSFLFSPVDTPTKSENLSCKIEVWHDNLLLSESACNVSYKVIASQPRFATAESESENQPAIRVASLSLIDPTNNKKNADLNDNFHIVVKVKNSGDVRGEANVQLYVDGKPIDNRKVNVGAHGEAEAITSIPNIKKDRFAKVMAKLDNGASSKEVSIRLLPFYNH